MALTSSCCVDFKLQFIVPMHHQKTHVIPRRGVSPDVGIPIDIPEIWRGLPRH